MEQYYDLIIIGAKPAGMSVAVYGGKVGLKIAMLEMGAPGGKLIKTVGISNWPGITEIDGVKLANDMFEHSISFDAEYLYGNAIRVEDGTYKKIVCEGGTEYEVKTVTVTTGTQERVMNVPGGLENVGRGVSHCAVYDGAFFHSQGVVVIDGGNSTLEEANYLAQFANRVNITIRRDVFRADNIVRNAVKDNPKITMVTRYVPVRVIDNGMRVTGLVVWNVGADVGTEMETHDMFLYIELDLVTSSLEELDILDECGYAITGENCEAKAEGTCGVGDVIAKKLRQIVTATNDGATMTQHAFHEIKGT